MRAYGFLAPGGPDSEAFMDVPVPTPASGELLVSVRAAAVNPGDHRLRRGSYGDIPRGVLGREVAGTVIETGPNSGEFSVGDEVFGGCPDMQGGFAEKALVTAGFAALRPAAVSPERASALPVAAGTAHDVLRQLNPPAGATLLVNGAGGGVGVPAVQLARARGIRVVGTASPAKHELLERFGAVPVAYHGDVAAAIEAAAPDGVDFLLDLVGGDSLRTVAALLPNPSALISIADKELGRELGGSDLARDRSTAVLEELVAAVAAGTLDPNVTDVRPFDDAPGAMAAVESGHSTGKVVLSF